MKERERQNVRRFILACYYILKRVHFPNVSLSINMFLYCLWQAVSHYRIDIARKRSTDPRLYKEVILPLCQLKIRGNTVEHLCKMSWMSMPVSAEKVVTTEAFRRLRSLFKRRWLASFRREKMFWVSDSNKIHGGYLFVRAERRGVVLKELQEAYEWFEQNYNVLELMTALLRRPLDEFDSSSRYLESHTSV